MQTRTSFLYATLTVLVVTMGVAAWFLSSLTELHDRFARQSRGLGVGFLILLIVLLAVGTLWVGRIAWRSRTPERGPVKAPDDMIRAAAVQTEQAEGMIRQVGQRVGQSHAESKSSASFGRDRPAVSFTSSSSAPDRRARHRSSTRFWDSYVGKTDAIMGTTRQAESHTYTLEGVEGTVFLTDTPGLSEFGAAGSDREREARELATRADLLLFVLDHDLVRTEYEPLAALVRQGKRSIVVLNKTDRFTDADSAAILARLRERLRGLVAADDVVAVAASPRPMPVRRQRPDGSTETILEEQEPELQPLRDRIA